VLPPAALRRWHEPRISMAVITHCTAALTLTPTLLISLTVTLIITQP
jgi:hypothetical protein